jgi:hypothetical protein
MTIAQTEQIESIAIAPNRVKQDCPREKAASETEPEYGGHEFLQLIAKLPAHWLTAGGWCGD